MACANCKRSMKIVGNGLCNACYSRLRRRGTLERKYVVNRGSCSVEGCSAKSFAKNLCAHHYQKARHPLKSRWNQIRYHWKGQYPEVWDRFDAFLKDAGEAPSKAHQLRRIDVHLPWSKSNMAWVLVVPRADNYAPHERKAYGKEWNLRKKFGITGEQYAAMAAEQSGCCAICQEPERAINARSGRAQELAVDHDHETNEVRGLLCVACNRLIGYAREDIATLMKAIAYLRRHSTKLKAIS